MTNALTRLDDEQLPQIQKLVLTGYDFDYALHLVLQLTDLTAARAFLRELLPRESPPQDDLTFTFSERGRKLDYAINVGFTCRGLVALGLSEGFEKELDAKARAFLQGAPARASRLGDFGPSAAERWEDEFRPDKADVLLTIYAESKRKLEDVANKVSALASAHAGLAGWESESLRAEHLSDEKGVKNKKHRVVHFGFRDNISRPVIECSLLKDKNPRHSAGELLLGYANDAKFDLWDKTQTASDAAAFFKNGSFAVLRKVEQNERLFDKYLRKTADRIEAMNMTDLPTGDALIRFLKAKYCGRWTNGSRILPGEMRAPEEEPDDDHLQEEDKKFKFVKDDPDGLGCPFGAHVRRASPRDDPTLPARRRPLFRRGIPYGPPYRGPGDNTERGLIGLFFCASIEDQFEHIVSEWVEKMPMGPPRRGDAKDPLVGQHDESKSFFHIPMPEPKEPNSLSDQVRAERRRGGIELNGFDEPFVTTRGTLYAFFPSRSALEGLCSARPAQ